MEDVETLALYSRAGRVFDKMSRNRKRAYSSPSNYSQMAILRIPKWSISEKGSVYAYASCLIIQLILEHARKTCRESVFISIQACRLESMSNDNYIVISFGRSNIIMIISAWGPSIMMTCFYYFDDSNKNLLPCHAYKWRLLV